MLFRFVLRNPHNSVFFFRLFFDFAHAHTVTIPPHHTPSTFIPLSNLKPCLCGTDSCIATPVAAWQAPVQYERFAQSYYRRALANERFHAFYEPRVACRISDLTQTFKFTPNLSHGPSGTSLHVTPYPIHSSPTTDMTGFCSVQQWPLLAGSRQSSVLSNWRACLYTFGVVEVRLDYRSCHRCCPRSNLINT